MDTRHRILLVVATLLTGVGIGAAVATPPVGHANQATLATGRTDRSVAIQTSTPHDIHVVSTIYDQGATSGWHRHPGPELSIVKAGSVTLVKAPLCEPVIYTAGQAIFIPGGAGHLLTTGADGPAEVYTTYLVAADAEVRGDIDPPEECTAK